MIYDLRIKEIEYFDKIRYEISKPVTVDVGYFWIFDIT
jgi:hypothetical protein